MAVSLTLFGVYGLTLSALGDKTHYMNRDDPTWSYINVALAGVFVLLAAFFTIENVNNGCKCCVCNGRRNREENQEPVDMD